MIDFIKKSIALAFGAVTVIFTFVPETAFRNRMWITQCALFLNFDIQDVNTIISRLVCFLQVWILISVLYALFLKFRWWTTIKGQNYLIRVEYGNILKKKRCKKIISFDECYTTQVGSAPADINPRSICGQYLSLHPELDIQKLINCLLYTSPSPRD